MEGAMNKEHFEISQKLDKIQRGMTTMNDRLLHFENKMELLQMQMSKIKCNSSPTHALQSSENTNGVEQFWHDSGSENINGLHKDVLKEHIEKMVKDIDLENTDLLDDLLTGECLTSDETAEIIRRPARRDQVRKLVLNLRRKSSKKFTIFLEKLQKTSNYPHIARSLMDSYNNKRKSEFPRQSKCLVCVLKHDVLIKDVVDKLYSSCLLPTYVFEMILEGECDNIVIWDMILTNLNRHTDPQKVRMVLKETLSVKYEHIAASINKTRFPEVICQCSSVQQNTLYVAASLKSDSNGSLGDISTTSEHKLFNEGKIGAHSRGTESSRSEHSENSTQIDYKNIPKTVAWLESIPKDLTQHVEERTSDAILNELVNDTISVMSLDIDSVSKAGAPIHNEDQNNENRTSSYATVTSVVDEDNSGRTESESCFINREYNETRMPLSYASAVSGNTATRKDSQNKQSSVHTSSGMQNKRMLKNSGGSPKYVRKTSDIQQAESLSEIGTIYLSQTETKDYCSTIYNQTNDEHCSSKMFNKRPNHPEKNEKKPEPSKQKIQQRQTDVKLELSNSTPANITDNCKILENIFFEEQRKIHGNVSSANNSTINLKCDSSFMTNKTTDRTLNKAESQAGTTVTKTKTEIKCSGNNKKRKKKKNKK